MIKKWFKLILWLCPPVLWFLLVAHAWEELDDPQSLDGGRLRYGQKELAPEWMPSNWTRSFLKEVHLEVSEALFARRLDEVANNLSSSVWVKSVGEIRRAYDGEMKLALEIRKPICLLRRGDRQTYLDSELKELNLLSQVHPERLNHETLPIVDVGGIDGVPLKQIDQWLGEMVNFVQQWNRHESVLTRMALISIKLDPYRGGSECRLQVLVKDLRFGGDVVLDWGVHRDYNELEDRHSVEKWKDLESAIAQERPFSALDLRYKKPDMR